MMMLKDILYRVRIEEVFGTTHTAIESIEFDSRKAGPFTCFVAIRGSKVDGHAYIEKAIEQGAVAIVCEEIPARKSEKVTYVRVANSSESLGLMASNFYDNPSKDLKVVAVTGTNGKTSTVTMLYNLFSRMGYPSGMLSTVVNKVGRKEIPSTHTTPDALSVQKLLRQMADEGCEYCFMEASSHAIHQHRITGVEIDVAVFTNITHEHLDYHGTFNEYIAAKKALFDRLPEGSHALINADDKHGQIMVQNTAATVHSFAVKSMADYQVKILENQFSGMQLNMNGHEFWTALVGGFNAYNLAAVFGAAVLLGKDTLDVLTDLSSTPPAEGRFQAIRYNGINAIVDYAHTPDALSNVLSTIKDIRSGNEQVITVVGCGGDRDRSKRPVMAEVACDLSDRVILTSDNPRTEEPMAIIQEMQTGVPPVHFKKTLSIPDRREAIKTAVSISEPGDIILIAGKGHEKYQEINGVKHDFDDLAIVQDMFKMIKGEQDAL